MVKNKVIKKSQIHDKTDTFQSKQKSILKTQLKLNCMIESIRFKNFFFIKLSLTI